MSNPNSMPQARRRRADRHRSADTPNTRQAPLRAGYQPDEEAPMPLGGYDAARPQGGQPRGRVAPPSVYEETDYHPPRRDPAVYAQPVRTDEYEDADLPPRRWPWILLALLLAAAVLFASAYFFIPKDAAGILGQARTLSHSAVDGGLALLGLKKKEPPRLIKFETPEETVQTGVRTVFTLTASQGIENVRILDEEGVEIAGVKEPADPPANTTWTVTAILDKPMTATLSAGIMYSKTWYQTDKTVRLTVVQPTPTPEIVSTPLITPAVTPAMTPAFTPVITPAVTPTSAPVITPTPPPAGTATAEPVATPEAVTPQSTPSLQALLPVFTPLPFTSAPEAPEFPEEDIPEDMLAEFPEEVIPGDMLVELPGELVSAAAEQILPEQAPTQPPVTPSPTATPMPVLITQASEARTPARMKITEAAYMGSRKQSDYARETPINMQGGDLYTYYPGGVFTFRGDGMRGNASFGTADMPLEELSILWQTELGGLRTSDSGTLYGLGWTGQPAIVKWAVEVRDMMNLSEEKKQVKALKEVIFAAQDGKVYFLDLNDGLPTRDPIDVGFPLKGSVAVDAIGRPIIAFGQGVSKLPGKTGDIGYYIYNLIDQTKLDFINGRKTKNQLQYSTNGAFDGTGLFDRQSDSLVIAGENGLLYTVKLNTVFDFMNARTITIDPEITYLRSKGNQDDTTVSIEGSAAMYGPYAFVADKQGILRCVDTTAMKTVWAFDTGDNTDATPALDLEGEDTLALYTGTTVFNRTRRDGNAVIRRINALTGEEAWSFKVRAKYDDSERSGVKASPVVGQGEIGNLVIFTVNKTDEGGAMLALDKRTGEQIWKVPLPAGAVSSPVAVYATDGRARIIQADLSGRLYLVNGLTGQVISTLDLGGTIEGSPAVYNDVLVIGTSGRDNSRMYGIRIE